MSSARRIRRRPTGVTLRAYRPGDDEAALGMFEDAFAEWPDRDAVDDRRPGARMTIERDGLRAGGPGARRGRRRDRRRGVHHRLRTRSGSTSSRSVATDRHRGIARALLQVAFQRGFDRGYTASSLSTDSNTGALTLYERVGMQIRETVHAPRDRPLINRLAVAEGFEPSGELPPHALSRRVPSAARAGHRDESSGRFGGPPRPARGLRCCDRRATRTRAGRSAAGGTRRCRTTRGGTGSWRTNRSPMRCRADGRTRGDARCSRHGYGRGTFTVTSQTWRSRPATCDEPVAVGAVDEAVRPQMHDDVHREVPACRQIADEPDRVVELTAHLGVHPEPARDRGLASAEHHGVTDRVAARRDPGERGRGGQHDRHADAGMPMSMRKTRGMRMWHPMVGVGRKRAGPEARPMPSRRRRDLNTRGAV